ncbi:hypothetical protein CRG98_041789, partial [Punica granatum]
MAEDGGSERGDTMHATVSMDSTESRWVFQEDESDIEDDEGEGYDDSPALDSDDDNAEHRLIRTGPRVDSFDVEALEVPGTQRNEYE